MYENINFAMFPFADFAWWFYHYLKATQVLRGWGGRGPGGRGAIKFELLEAQDMMVHSFSLKSRKGLGHGVVYM